MSQRILIIDDDPLIRETIEDLLLTGGYTPLVASNGNEALQKLWFQKCDLILLDIHMPEMSGKGFIELLGQQNYQIPVIVVSGMDVNEIKNYFFEKGAISFLKKPFKNSTLLSLIQNTLRLANSYSSTTGGNENAEISEFLPDLNDMEIEDQLFLNRLLKLINQNLFNNQFGVKFIAEEMELSSRHFNRKMNQYFSKTAHQAISEVRFKMIHNLIVNNEMSLNEVSRKIGYSSVHYFKKMYRQHVKC